MVFLQYKLRGSNFSSGEMLIYQKRPSEILILTFALLAITQTLMIHYKCKLEYQIYVAVTTVINFVALKVFVERAKTYSKNVQKDDFECPLVPLVPCISIYANIFLFTQGLANNQNTTMVQYLIFEGVGIFFYISYGLHNSKLQQRLYEFA